jgi:hypothetical protein
MHAPDTGTGLRLFFVHLENLGSDVSTETSVEIYDECRSIWPGRCTSVAAGLDASRGDSDEHMLTTCSREM